MDNLSIFGDIGNVIGYPAMLLIFWLYNKVKDLEKRMQDGNSRFDRIERELKETNGLLRELLGMFRVSNHGAAVQPVRTYQDVVDREG